MVEAVHAWMKDYRHATGYHPSTGWIAYRLLREQFPAARITLVDFCPDGDIGTYKWPKHDWVWEAVFYRKHGVEVVSARGFTIDDLQFTIWKVRRARARGAERRGSIQVSQYCRSSPIPQKIAVQAFFRLAVARRPSPPLAAPPQTPPPLGFPALVKHTVLGIL